MEFQRSCVKAWHLNLIVFIFSARNEHMTHTYEGGAKVEMQQFDKLRYYFCGLLCCLYDEFTATVCISAMLMKRDQAPRYVEMSLQRSSEPCWSKNSNHVFLTFLCLWISSLNVLKFVFTFSVHGHYKIYRTLNSIWARTDCSTHLVFLSHFMHMEVVLLNKKCYKT